MAVASDPGMAVGVGCCVVVSPSSCPCARVVCGRGKVSFSLCVWVGGCRCVRGCIWAPLLGEVGVAALGGG